MIIRENRISPKRRSLLLLDFIRLDLGANAIEFALIIPFLLMLTGGIVEMSNLFFVRSQLNEIVRDATRRLAVDAFDQSQAKNFILSKLAETTDATGDIEMTETTEKGEGVTDITVSLRVPLRDVLIFDFVADSLGSSGEEQPDLSVAVTMFKH